MGLLHGRNRTSMESMGQKLSFVAWKSDEMQKVIWMGRGECKRFGDRELAGLMMTFSVNLTWQVECLFDNL